MKIRVRAIIKRGNTLLLVRHRNPETGGSYNTWSLPGGGIDDGEMLLDALTREIMEETGIQPKIGKLLYIYQYTLDGVYQGPEFFFNVENTNDYLNIDLTKTTHGIDEIAEIGFYDPRELDIVLPEFLKNIDVIDAHNSPQLVIKGEYYG